MPVQKHFMPDCRRCQFPRLALYMQAKYTGMPAWMINNATPTNFGVVHKGSTIRNAQINKYNIGSKMLT